VEVVGGPLGLQGHEELVKCRGVACEWCLERGKLECFCYWFTECFFGSWQSSRMWAAVSGYALGSFFSWSKTCKWGVLSCRASWHWI